MKKSNYAFLGSLLIIAMILGSTTSVRGTTYTCTGVVGAEAVWRVKTVHNGTLTAIFGPTWQTTIENSFLAGSHIEGARMKSKVTFVNSSYNFAPPYVVMAPVDACLILSDLWLWTTDPFSNTPNSTNVATIIFSHPENLTTYCQQIGVSFPVFAGNVSQRNAAPYMNAILIPAATYLSELLWDNDYSISGTTVTHNVPAFYIGWFGVYGVNCVETWRYSSSYGTFLGYQLKHNNGTIAYETELEVGEAAIPGFELTIILGVSMGVVISLIYIIMKKRK